jgi:hypothetical protein
MAKRVLDHNPLTGETVYFDYSDDRLSISHEHDVSGILEDTLTMRNDEDYSRKGIKNDQWHYARIPNGVMMEMKAKHGVDMFGGKIDWPAVFRCINTHYPYLKTTTKQHA